MKTFSLRPFLVFAVSAVLLSCMDSFLSDDDDSSDEGTVYTVTYNANSAASGNVPVDSKTYAKGASVTVLGNSGNLMKTGFEWKGWNTDAGGTGTTYTAGQTFTMGTANVVLYAKWAIPGGTALWAQTVLDASDLSIFNDAATDTSGNIYAVGYQKGTTAVVYGTGVQASGAYASGTNAVIVKYDSSGKALWAKSVLSAGSDSSFKGVAVDSSGNAYAVGTQAGNGDFIYETGVTAAGGFTSTNPVIVKYDPTGKALWAKSVLSAGSYSSFKGVAVDSYGNAYAVGTQNGNGDFTYETGVIAKGGYTTTNPVIVKYASTGEAQWARTTVSASGESSFSGVSADAAGNAYVVGRQDGNTPFEYGTGVSVSGGSSSEGNAVIVKYDSSGTPLWAYSVTGGSADSSFMDVAADPSGSIIYAAGKQYGDEEFSYGSGVTAKGIASISNTVVVRYDASGSAVWASTLVSASESSTFASIATDSSNNVYVAGNIFDGTYTYGTGVSTSGGNSNYNSVIVKYDSSGEAKWARSVDPASGDSAFGGVAADSSGNVYAAGKQAGTGGYTYGTDIVVNGKYDLDYNAVIVKYFQ